MDYLITFANASTILLCIFCKIPQILAIIKSKSVEGLSVTSVIVELFGYSIVLGYNIVMKYAYSAFLEYFFLVAQDILLVLLLFYYKESLDIMKFGYMGMFIAAFYSFTLGIPHPQILPNLIKVVTPISASSKLIQLKEIWVTKQSESVSCVTWSIAAYTCITRIFTTLVSTGDFPLLVNYSIALMLNLSIIFSALHFRKSKTTLTGETPVGASSSSSEGKVVKGDSKTSTKSGVDKKKEL